MIVFSLIYVFSHGGIKCRVYEDDEETWVSDINNTIRRKIKKTIDINLYSHEE